MGALTAAYFIRRTGSAVMRVDQADKAVCIVRDGRDSLVSWARLNGEHDESWHIPNLGIKIPKLGMDCGYKGANT
jgi:hypothetical protein